MISWLLAAEQRYICHYLMHEDTLFWRDLQWLHEHVILSEAKNLSGE